MGMILYVRSQDGLSLIPNPRLICKPRVDDPKTPYHVLDISESGVETLLGSYPTLDEARKAIHHVCLELQGLAHHGLIPQTKDFLVVDMDRIIKG